MLVFPSTKLENFPHSLILYIIEYCPIDKINDLGSYAGARSAKLKTKFSKKNDSEQEFFLSHLLVAVTIYVWFILYKIYILIKNIINIDSRLPKGMTFWRFSITIRKFSLASMKSSIYEKIKKVFNWLVLVKRGSLVPI